MLAVVGMGSQIAKEVVRLIAQRDTVADFGRDRAAYREATRFLFCAGVLKGQPAIDMSEHDIRETCIVNFTDTVRWCEIALEWSPFARICIIGSESGISGSFDKIYAGSKAAIHNYIETRRVGPHQQLVGIAPSIIGDAGMTLRRTDTENLERREKEHPKGRFLKSSEVAELVVFLLYTDLGYITNTVVRMNGGEHVR